MCHISFMSTATDSWSGFRVHAVIFQRASVPSQLTASVFVRKRGRLSVYLSPSHLSGRKETEHKSGIKHDCVEKREKGEMKRKLITSKQMAPHFTVAPRGLGGTTLCTSGLVVLQRGRGT